MGLIQAYRRVIAAELTVDDFDDYFEELEGLDDKEQFKGMLGRAIEIAKKDGKGSDKDTIIGIMQSFMQG